MIPNIRAREIGWKPIGDPPFSDLAYTALAVRIQHHQAFAIREAIMRRHVTIKAFTDASGGQLTTQFHRMLTGSAVMQPHELGYVLVHFGDDLHLPDAAGIIADTLYEYGIVDLY